LLKRFGGANATWDDFSAVESVADAVPPDVLAATPGPL
jgi:hypothetical protein